MQLRAIIAALSLLGAGVLAGITYDTAVQANSPDNIAHYRPGGGNGGVKMKRNIAVKICVAMARSGAYTALDDNEFSDHCIKVASHLGDSEYDHTD